MQKTLEGIYSPPSSRWLGDGFPVRTLFDYRRHGTSISPFLLLDHAGPVHFKPSPLQHSMGTHPHRGYETVTIVYEGEVSHRDTTGLTGTIGPDQVQWMTAGSGVLHEELHSHTFAQQGGRLEMVQLWVNLPTSQKMRPPRYQSLTQADIPEQALPQHAGKVRVIAGEFEGQAGAAKTHTPINVWDVRLHSTANVHLSFPANHTLMVLVLKGVLHIQGQLTHNGQWLQLSRQGSTLHIKASTDATLLVMSGEPIHEPVVGQGPFVMNTEAEVDQALQDLRNGHFGQLPALVAPL